jgi:hypothetical protein
MLLIPQARRACSSWSVVGEEVAERGVAALESALRSGAWDRAHGALRQSEIWHGSLRLVVAEEG